jgi:hypothetical protein
VPPALLPAGVRAVRGPEPPRYRNRDSSLCFLLSFGGGYYGPTSRLVLTLLRVLRAGFRRSRAPQV